MNVFEFIRTRIRPLLWGLCVGVIFTALLLLLAALLIRSVVVPRAAVVPLAYAAAGAGAFAGGLLTARLTGQNGLLSGAVCGVLFYGILLSASCLLADGGSGTPLWVKPLLLTACGAVGGVFGVNRKKR